MVKNTKNYQIIPYDYALLFLELCEKIWSAYSEIAILFTSDRSNQPLVAHSIGCLIRELDKDGRYTSCLNWVANASLPKDQALLLQIPSNYGWIMLHEAIVNYLPVISAVIKGKNLLLFHHVPKCHGTSLVEYAYYNKYSDLFYYQDSFESCSRDYGSIPVPNCLLQLVKTNIDTILITGHYKLLDMIDVYPEHMVKKHVTHIIDPIMQYSSALRYNIEQIANNNFLLDKSVNEASARLYQLFMSGDVNIKQFIEDINILNRSDGFVNLTNELLVRSLSNSPISEWKNFCSLLKSNQRVKIISNNINFAFKYLYDIQLELPIKNQSKIKSVSNTNIYSQFIHEQGRNANHFSLKAYKFLA